MATDIMATSTTKLTLFHSIILTRFVCFALASLKILTNSLRSAQIERLQAGLEEAAKLFSFYKLGDEDMSDFPLLEGRVPDGGAADSLIAELAERVGGEQSRSCVEELGGQDFTPKMDGLKVPNKFVC